MDEGKAVLNVVPHPTADINDVVARLRSLADNIESGNFGTVHNVAWVADCGGGKVEVGLVGFAPEPASAAHFLFHCGAMKLLVAGRAATAQPIG